MVAAAPGAIGVDFETVCKKQQHGRSNDGLAVTTNSARYNDSAGAAIPLGADLGLPRAIFKIPSSVYIRGLPLPSLLRPSLGESGIARGVGRGARTRRGRGGSASPVDSPARRWAVLRAHGAGRGRVSWVAAVEGSKRQWGR